MPKCIPLLQDYINGTDSAYCQTSIFGLLLFVIILFFYVWLIKDIVVSYKKPLKHFGEQRVRKIVNRLVLLVILLGASFFFSNLLSELVMLGSADLILYKIIPYSFILFIALYIYVYWIGTKKYLSDKDMFKRN